jgi:hypothetical protein
MFYSGHQHNQCCFEIPGCSVRLTPTGAKAIEEPQ